MEDDKSSGSARGALERSVCPDSVEPLQARALPAALASGDIRHTAVRRNYEELGVKGFYEAFGDQYVNPHEAALKTVLRCALRRWHILPVSDSDYHILDLACGSGEAYRILKDLGFANVQAVDPYTAEAFEARTGSKLYAEWTFEDVAGGCLQENYGEQSEPKTAILYELIVCSFAAHLIPDSYMMLVMSQLALAGKRLIILTPHKRPIIHARWGWTLQDEFVHERVRARFYLSSYHGD